MFGYLCVHVTHSSCMTVTTFNFKFSDTPGAVYALHHPCMCVCHITCHCHLQWLCHKDRQVPVWVSKVAGRGVVCLGHGNGIPVLIPASWALVVLGGTVTDCNRYNHRWKLYDTQTERNKYTTIRCRQEDKGLNPWNVAEYKAVELVDLTKFCSRLYS